MKTAPAIFLMLLMSIVLVKQASGCCCTIFPISPYVNCYCNPVGCNCENSEHPDFCYHSKWSKEHVWKCTKGSEICSDKRIKRSIDPVMENIMNNSQYTKLYGHLIGIPALEVFFYHDLNKVRIIFYFAVYLIFLIRMA